MELASRSSRLQGQLLDGLIAFLPLVVAFIVSAINEAAGHPVVILALLLAIGYYFFADGLPGGGSYAKQLLHLEVIDATSRRPCTFWQSFVRNLLLTILGPLDWIFIFGRRRQRLGDMAAGTVVVVAADRIDAADGR
jgi:uncharacterized RDD family membrane protein YckC